MMLLSHYWGNCLGYSLGCYLGCYLVRKTSVYARVWPPLGLTRPGAESRILTASSAVLWVMQDFRCLQARTWAPNVTPVSLVFYVLSPVGGWLVACRCPNGRLAGWLNCWGILVESCINFRRCIFFPGVPLDWYVFSLTCLGDLAVRWTSHQSVF